RAAWSPRRPPREYQTGTWDILCRAVAAWRVERAWLNQSCWRWFARNLCATGIVAYGSSAWSDGPGYGLLHCPPMALRVSACEHLVHRLPDISAGGCSGDPSARFPLDLFVGAGRCDIDGRSRWCMERDLSARKAVRWGACPAFFKIRQAGSR